VKGNTITYSLGDGIVFSCTTGNTVTKNVINNANIGLDWVPDGFIGSNTFYNVNTRISSGAGVLDATRCKYAKIVNSGALASGHQSINLTDATGISAQSLANRLLFPSLAVV